jgi:hypothetical protein
MNDNDLLYTHVLEYERKWIFDQASYWQTRETSEQTLDRYKYQF